MKLIGILAALAVIAFSNVSFAYDYEEIAPGYNACMDATQGVTSQMLKCQEKAYSFVDTVLNVNYQMAMKACNKEGDPKACKATILKMQRAWIKYKEATADYLFKALDAGSLTPVLVNDFVNQATKDQGKKLELMLNR